MLTTLLRLLSRNNASRPASLIQDPDEGGDLITRIRRRKLTYLSERKLASIVETCRDIEREGLDGTFIEAGCALGGSTILIGMTKGLYRPLQVYDLFGMNLPMAVEDLLDGTASTAPPDRLRAMGALSSEHFDVGDDLLAQVSANLLAFGIDPERESVAFVRGLLQDTLRPVGPIAFVHVDVDRYQPVKVCLDRVFPRLVVGGSIILDDYHDWGGCRRATDEFLRTVVGEFDVDDSAGSLKITRCAAARDAFGGRNEPVRQRLALA
jgi:asparagine synthase (glutamine-hydrolysing)